MSEKKSLVWSPTFGSGTLDYQPNVAAFKANTGVEFLIPWTVSRTGPPRQPEPRGKDSEDEWRLWLSLTTKHGEVFTFRRGGPPPNPTTKSIGRA